jgi:hypothetical protein
MKVSATTPEPTTRKEAYGKEVTAMHLRRNSKDEHDQGRPRRWRAVIYIYEPDAVGRMARNGEVSVARQRDLCRSKAVSLKAKVVGEFADVGFQAHLRDGLRMALETAQTRRVNYLIVVSLDHLLDGTEGDAFEIGWRIGNAGIYPIPAYSGD